MAIAYKVPAELREDQGKGASRRLRREGKVPAIVYGGERKPANIQLPHNYLLKVLADEAFQTSILELIVGDKVKQKVVLRDVQMHPFKLQVMHLDFQRILDDQVIKISVPLHFIGGEESPAGKASGVVISHQMTEVDIACLPANLPEFLEVDLSAMEAGMIIHLSDIKLPEGVELPDLALGDDHDHAIATAGRVGGASEETDKEDGEESEEAAEE
ncbi:MAG: 50S ribosomal protein L25/general stress protein Ctc [bacterium]